MTDQTQSAEEQAFQQLDTNKIKEEVSKDLESKIDSKASEVADKKVKERLSEFGKQISGQKDAKYSWQKEGREKPKSWDEAADEMVKHTSEAIEKKLEQKEKAATKKKKAKQDRLKQSEKARREKMSSQWQELVNKGALPEIDSEVSQKLQSGQTIDQQTAQSDQGLQAWRQIAKTAQNKNKTFKEAYYEDYLSETAGQGAPVFGAKAKVDSTDSSAEYSYEDVKKARQRL